MSCARRIERFTVALAMPSTLPLPSLPARLVPWYGRAHALAESEAATTTRSASRLPPPEQETGYMVLGTVVVPRPDKAMVSAAL